MQIKTLLAAAVIGASHLHAADFFVSPSGSGTKDGTSVANSAPASLISPLFNETLKPGDRLLLGSGEYKDAKLDLRTGGEKSKPKTIEAAEDAVLSSNWTIERPDKGATAIQIAPGLSHVVFKNISIRNYCFAILARPSSGNPRSGLTFEGISVEQMRHGFYLSDCDSLKLIDCTLKRYSKHGYRFDQGCDDILVKNCLADCSEGDAAWETKTELLPFGFNINRGGAPNTKFTFEDCVSKNNIKSNQKGRYTNGDGFVVEGNTTDVTFTRCHALRNQDGGFDLKVDNVVLTDCVSTHCRRSYRFWKTATIRNCFSGWTSAAVWSKGGGSVTAEDSTFIGLARTVAEVEGKTDQVITLSNCIYLPLEGSEKFQPKIGDVLFEDCVTEGVAFIDPVDTWDGTGKNYNSTSHPAKGFSSTRIGR